MRRSRKTCDSIWGEILVFPWYMSAMDISLSDFQFSERCQNEIGKVNNSA